MIVKKKLKKVKKVLDLYTLLFRKISYNMRGNMKNLKHFNTSRSQYSSQNNYSSFWLDNEFDRHTSIFDEEDVKPKTDLIA